MASFNKVILIGNLVADPELKKTQSGVSVTSFRIAVGRRFTRQGEQPQADFIDIVAWRQQAEFVTRFFTKGKPILVCGQLQTRTWTDNNGQKRYATEVVADEITFVGNKSDGSGGGNYGGYNAPAPGLSDPQPNYSSAPDAGFEDLSADDELPF